MQKASVKRWELAQSYEKNLWASVSEQWLLEHAKHYSKKASIITEKALKNFSNLKNLKILQIGCGPMDVINQIEFGKKYSIDPLADFYKKKFKFDYKETNFIKGVGEKLPYENEFFDVVIFANVLDHTSNPEEVLSEIKRVLKPNGIVHLEAHFYQLSFIMLSRVYGIFKKAFTGKIFNPCHPYMFQLYELKDLVKKYFFVSDEKTGEDIEKGLKNLDDIKNSMKKEKMARKLPAMFGLLGLINYTCLCRKKLNTITIFQSENGSKKNS